MIKLKRLLHIFLGHPYKGSKQVEKLVSKNHPNNKANYSYVVNLRECTCGLIFKSDGVESHDFIHKRGIYGGK